MKKLTWYSIIIIALAGFTTLSIGFLRAVDITESGRMAAAAKPADTGNSPAPTAAVKKDPNLIKILVLGDSVAKGTGDEKGQGMATYLTDGLRNQTTKELSVDNLGINGLESEGLLAQLRNDRLKPLLTASDIVLVSIGGNDIRSLRAQDEMTKATEFKNLEGSYLDSLKQALGIIRQNNPNTYIVFVGLYNPYEDKAASSQDTRLLNSWNYDTQQLVEADPKAVFIPTYDIFKFNLNRFIASDGLHPNTMGYQAVSNRIAKSIENLFNKE